MHGLLLTGFIATLGVPVYTRTGGAHRLATYLREKGWDIEVLDFIMGWSLDELKEYTRSRVTSKTKFIGFGGTFPIWSDTLDAFFKWVKVEYKDIPLIAGGQVVNSYKIEADWYVEGFGERGTEALLKHITNTGSEKLKYQLGVFGRKIIKSNLDYPAFPMKSLKIKYQDRDFINSNETLTTELGRGCIFNCDFCNFPVLGVKEDHTRDADDLYEELQDTYDRFGVTKYLLADETVNDYTEKLEKFASVIRKLNFRPRFLGFARADLLVSRPQDWDIMLEMGFVGHHYGIESMNYQSVKAIGKGMHPDKLLPKLLDARKYFKKHGFYRGQMSIIAGLPYETPETFDNGLNWLRENWSTEGSLVFPLYIPTENGGDNMSKMSLTWKKHGYEEIDKNHLSMLKEKYKTTMAMAYGVGDSLVSTTGMLWKNKEWDILTVADRVAKYWHESYYPYHNGPPMWNLGLWEIVLNKPATELLDRRIIDIAPNMGFIREQSKIYIDAYIAKKLNYTSHA
jgi:radical SAM superfamily enzyme YgiQ (UPF0313 family)